MKTLFLLIALFPIAVHAQKNESFYVNGLPTQGILLDSCWKWHAGDNPEWLKPAYADDTWGKINPTKEIVDLPQIREAEIACLRLHLWVDTALVNKAIALQLWQTGASEIYLNGVLLHAVGTVGKNSRAERTFLPNGYPYSLTFVKPGPQLIAVRYSFTKSNVLMKYRAGNFPCFRIVLSNLDETWAHYFHQKNDSAFLNYNKSGILLFLGLLHLFFFVSYRKQAANLFISLYAFCQAYTYYLGYHNTLPIAGHAFYVNFLLFFIFSILSGVFSLLVVYSYLKLSKGPMFWIMLGLIFASYTIWLYAPYFGYFYNMFGIAGILAFEAIRVSLKTIRRNNSGPKFIIAGWVLSLVFMSITYLMTFGLLPSFKYGLDVCINLGLLSVPICYSLMLAGDYARTNKVLFSKLTEVEALSAEKEHILSAQNETLEKQVAERTAALNQSLQHLQSTQAQLVQSEKLASLGELTAGIAHEIQNPLNFVNNFSELSVELIEELKIERTKAARDMVLEEELLTDLSLNQEKINHHGKRAANIVTGMLQHARTGTGAKEPIDLNALADEYLRLSYHGLRAKDSSFNAKMVTDFDPSIGKAAVIPQDMGRVLLNLINNAFYAVHQRNNERNNVGEVLNLADVNADVKKYEPTVTVSTRMTTTCTIEIRIRDNGTGIPEAVKAKIFQPFFTTKPTGQGTGLGLSLAYDIVTKGHGGTLDVESESGKGTEFTITIPKQ